MKIEHMAALGLGVIGVGALFYHIISQQPQVVEVPEEAPPGMVKVGMPSFTGIPPATGCESRLLAIASQQLGIPPNELIVRGLRPADVGLTTSFAFTSTVANTWENWVSTTIADNTFICINGVAYSGTTFSQMRIHAGAKYVEYWPLGFISGLESQIWFDASPPIVEQNQPLVIDIISTGAATEYPALMGTVVEKRGLVVSP